MIVGKRQGYIYETDLSKKLDRIRKGNRTSIWANSRYFVDVWYTSQWGFIKKVERLMKERIL
jgi:hypothetical protein